MKATDTSNIRLAEQVYLQGDIGAFKYLQPNRQVSLVMCSVKTGSVDLFIGSNPVTVSAPFLHFGQVNMPVWVPIPLGTYEFTAVAASNGTVASLLLGGPDVG